MEQTIFRVDVREPGTERMASLQVPALSRRAAADSARAKGWYVDGVTGDEPEPDAGEPQAAMLTRPVRTVAYGVVLGHLLLILIAFAVFVVLVLVRAVAH